MDNICNIATRLAKGAKNGDSTKINIFFFIIVLSHKYLIAGEPTGYFNK